MGFVIFFCFFFDESARGNAIHSDALRAKLHRIVADQSFLAGLRNMVASALFRGDPRTSNRSDENHTAGSVSGKLGGGGFDQVLGGGETDLQFARPSIALPAETLAKN